MAGKHVVKAGLSDEHVGFPSFDVCFKIYGYIKCKISLKLLVLHSHHLQESLRVF